ncbi:hypothetical protein [Solirubrobacter soli]|uniref:hypothetical protein n=1 Tax=Solirubrobacter soli TaxID=363832 RepID=UPI0003F89C27|nr:hypothetical protein [Solirubrobacter soli]
MATDHYEETARPRSGVSLAKGPVAALGLASLALGVLGFIFASRSFTFDAPSGTVTGTTFIGIEGNGWTWVVFAAAGLLLLLGSTIHWGAKSMAFIVGVAFVVGALIALSDGDDILGVVAMNNWTTLVMGAGGAALIVLSMMPRVGRRRGAAPTTVEERRNGRFARDREPIATTTAADDRAATTRHEPLVDDRAATTRHEPLADDRAATTRHETLDEPATTRHGAVAASERRAPLDDDRR